MIDPVQELVYKSPHQCGRHILYLQTPTKSSDQQTMDVVYAFPPLDSCAFVEPSFRYVDHPYEQQSKPMRFLRGFSRKRSKQKTIPTRPTTDIRDAGSHYMMEVEAPGVKDESSITLYWTTPRSLVVAGNTFRPESFDNGLPLTIAAGGCDIPNTHVGLDDKEIKALQSSKRKQLDTTKAMQRSEDPQSWPHLLVSERMINFFRREYYFPVDIDMGNVKASLEAGLLRINLPKNTETSNGERRTLN